MGFISSVLHNGAFMAPFSKFELLRLGASCFVCADGLVLDRLSLCHSLIKRMGTGTYWLTAVS